MNLRFILVFLCFISVHYSLFSGIKSLAGLSYHPDSVMTQPNLFNEGNTAFAIDNIKDDQVFLSTFYANKKIFNNDQSQSVSSNNFTLSDISDPYQGVFYHYPLGSENLKILVGANLSFSYTGYDFQFQGSPNPNQADFGGKIMASVQYKDFYFGGLLIVQGVMNNNYPYSGFTSFLNVNGGTDIAPANPKSEFTNIPFYYQLAAGYNVASNFKVGLSLDNIYQMNTNRIDGILLESEYSGDKIVPYMMNGIFQSQLYRFNLQNGSAGHTLVNDMNINGTDYMVYIYENFDKLKITVIHLSPSLQYQFKYIDLVCKLDFYYISYQNDITIGIDPVTQVILQTDIHDFHREGSFINLNYYFLLTPKPIQISSFTTLLFQIKLTGSFYSKLKETLTSTENPDVNITQDVDFSFQKLGLTFGLRKEKKEVWAYFNYTNYSYTFSNYNSGLMNLDPAFYNNLNFYAVGSYPAGNEGLGRTSDINVFEFGLATRVPWQQFVFDLGIGYINVKYPVGLFKVEAFENTFGVLYQLNNKLELKLTYVRNTYIHYDFQYQNYQSYDNLVILEGRYQF